VNQSGYGTGTQREPGRNSSFIFTKRRRSDGTITSRVYIEEVSSASGRSRREHLYGSFSREGGTGRNRQSRPGDEPAEFQKKYGSFLSDASSLTGLPILQQRGKTCYIVRIAGTGARQRTSRSRRKGSPAKTLTIRAASEGTWGNTIDIVVATAP